MISRPLNLQGAQDLTDVPRHGDGMILWRVVTQRLMAI
jgi:hypothetical protein